MCKLQRWSYTAGTMISSRFHKPCTLLLLLASGCADRCAEPGVKDDTGPCPTWYFDLDGDGYGQDERATVSCSEPRDHALQGGDCDDSSAEIHPGAPELCDTYDNDCDGTVDEDLELLPWYPDADGDGYGDPLGEPVEGCAPPSGYAGDPTDCDDGDPLVHPGAEDLLCDGLDADCDGQGAEAEAVYDSVEYGSVEEAVDAAERGAEVLVCPGRHDTLLELPGGTQLTLASWSGDPEDTVLSGGETHRIILVEPGSRLTVENLGLEDGYSDSPSPTYFIQAGAAVMGEDADLIMDGCVVRGNLSVRNGGAVTVYMAQDSELETRELTVRDCLFEDNGSDGVSALFYYSQGVGGDQYVTIEGSTFQHNTAQEASTVWVFGEHNPEGSLDARVSSCSFIENSSATGAFRFTHSGSEGSLTLSDSIFQDNYGSYPSGHGGLALDLSEGASAIVSGSGFVDNNATGANGGAIDMDLSGDNPWVEITGCNFEGNIAEEDGGAIEIGDVDGRGSVWILDSTFTGNAVGLLGGAIHHGYVWDGDESLSLLIDGCLFTDNTAGNCGGAIAGQGGEALIVIRDSLFEGNVAGEWGAALYASMDEIDLVIASTSFLDNTAWAGTVRLMGHRVDLSVEDSHFEGNRTTGSFGAAIDFVSGVDWPSLTLARTNFYSNSSPDLAAVGVPSWTVLEVDEVDWGSGSLDNSPADLCIGERGSYTCNADLGAMESFSCPGDGTCDW